MIEQTPISEGIKAMLTGRPAPSEMPVVELIARIQNVNATEVMNRCSEFIELAHICLH